MAATRQHLPAPRGRRRLRGPTGAVPLGGLDGEVPTGSTDAVGAGRRGSRRCCSRRRLTVLDLAPGACSTIRWPGTVPGPGGVDVGTMTIGEFAVRARLSPKALRLYDRLGLLRPGVRRSGDRLSCVLRRPDRRRSTRGRHPGVRPDGAAASRTVCTCGRDSAACVVSWGAEASVATVRRRGHRSRAAAAIRSRYAAAPLGRPAPQDHEAAVGQGVHQELDDRRRPVDVEEQYETQRRTGK